ncbi:MAG: hypothetical protein ACRC1R_08705 [Cetobacterium sp.]|uniref:hypothetical protein n=1 Tax=Cetobacterium sp. TaxID=2071632 RepID=UPI003F2F7E21
MKIEEIQKLESLNNEFRDILVGLREFLFASDETMYSDEARGFQRTMDNCVREGKKILRENDIKTAEELKAVCNKFLIPDFLNGLFDNNVYIPEEEIDCGL